MIANNEIKTIKVPLVNFGWFEVDPKTGKKEYKLAKDAFTAVIDLRRLGNISNKVYEKHGLTDPKVQRERSDSRQTEISETACGRRKMDGKLVDEMNGEAWEPKNLPFSCIISVKSSMVVEKETKFVGGAMRTFYYLIVPITEEAIEELAENFYIIDGQHTAGAFSDNKCMFSDQNIGFDAPVFVYFDLSDKERAEIFDNKNFQAKKAPSDQKYEHAKIRGTLSEEEDVLWDVLDILSSTRLETPGVSKPQFSVMRDGIKCGQKDTNKATRQQYCRYAVMDRSGKHVRDVNFVNAYKSMIKSIFDRDAVSAYEYACGINQYAIAFNSVHGKTDDDDVNMFVVNKNAGVSKTKVAVSFALAQACAEIIKNTPNALWDIDTITGILTIMRDDVFEGQTMLEYKGLGKIGGMDAYDFVIDVIKATIDACEGMTAEEIKERGNERLVFDARFYC
jgi:hypothetical protein